jgi:hypothetical protein
MWFRTLTIALVGAFFATSKWFVLPHLFSFVFQQYSKPKVQQLT